MIIAWQTVNAVRHPGSRRFSRGFLVVAPGLPIRDRLRVLQPNDPDSDYRSRELVPADLLADLDRARVVITNFHAFRRRETLPLSTGGRALLQGRGAGLRSLETEGRMLRRVMPGLMGMKEVLVLNDEAHHCYRERPAEADEEGALKGEDRKEAERNRRHARLWMGGLESVARTLGVRRIVDLSATPFFLRGSGYAEGTLFPWTMSDFSLMDAIECGIVKLPRVPVADNIPGGEMPKFRNLREHIRGKMPKKGRGKAEALDPLSLPVELQTALEALYGHYGKTFALWQAAGIEVPPCFIVVCNNTSTSKLVYDYVSGFHRGSGATPGRRRSSISSASSSGSPGSGSTAIWCTRAARTRPSSCTRSWPTWPASGSPAASWRGGKANARSRRCSTRTTPRARRCTWASGPRRRCGGRPAPVEATSTGRSATANGRRSSAAWRNRTGGCAPT